jgi:hypothetical protein
VLLQEQEAGPPWVMTAAGRMVLLPVLQAVLQSLVLQAVLQA